MHWIYFVFSIVLVAFIQIVLFIKGNGLISAGAVTCILFVFQSFTLFLIVYWFEHISDACCVLKSINKKLKAPAAQTDER